MPPITELTRIQPIGRGATVRDVIRPAGIDEVRARLAIELEPFVAPSPGRLAGFGSRR